MLILSNAVNANPDQSSIVTCQIEDYRGGQPIPCYGIRRPSADYYNSNLMGCPFILVDIVTGKNHVFFYDERGKGKRADAVCSLRLIFHMNE